MRADTNPTAGATLIIGADLRVSSDGAGWRALGLRGLGRLSGKRIDELFPSSDLRASVLDVLASGQTVKGVLVPIEDGGRTRYLCANLSPVPADARKPNKVLLRAHELDGWVLADAQTGEIIGANEVGARALGSDAATIPGKSLWESEALTNPVERDTIFAGLTRRGSVYLGRLWQKNSTGEAVELEGALVQAPDQVPKTTA
jgi:hypothetical protein